MPPKKPKITLDSVQFSAAQMTSLIRVLVGIGVFVVSSILTYTKIQYDQREELRGLRRDLDAVNMAHWSLSEQREFSHQMRNTNVHEILVPNVDSIRHEIRKSDK